MAFVLGKRTTTSDVTLGSPQTKLLVFGKKMQELVLESCPTGVPSQDG